MARRNQLTLPAGKVLTVTAGAPSSGTVRRLAASGDTTTNYAPAAVAASSSVVLGPFTADRAYEIITDVGPALAASITQADAFIVTAADPLPDRPTDIDEVIDILVAAKLCQ